MKPFVSISLSDYLHDSNQQPKFKPKGIQKLITRVAKANNWPLADQQNYSFFSFSKNPINVIHQQAKEFSASKEHRIGSLCKWRDQYFPLLYRYTNRRSIMYLITPKSTSHKDWVTLLIKKIKKSIPLPIDIIHVKCGSYNWTPISDIYSLELLNYYLSRNNQNQFKTQRLFLTKPSATDSLSTLAIPEELDLSYRQIKKTSFLYIRRFIVEIFCTQLNKLPIPQAKVNSKIIHKHINLFRKQAEQLNQEELKKVDLLLNPPKDSNPIALGSKHMRNKQPNHTKIQQAKDLFFLYIHNFFSIQIQAKQLTACSPLTFAPFMANDFFTVSQKDNNAKKYTLKHNGFLLALEEILSHGHFTQSHPDAILISFDETTPLQQAIKTRLSHLTLSSVTCGKRLGFILHNASSNTYLPFFIVAFPQRTPMFIVPTIDQSPSSQWVKPIKEYLYSNFPNTQIVDDASFQGQECSTSATSTLKRFEAILSLKNDTNIPLDYINPLSKFRLLHSNHAKAPQLSSIHYSFKRMLSRRSAMDHFEETLWKRVCKRYLMHQFENNVDRLVSPSTDSIQQKRQASHQLSLALDDQLAGLPQAFQDSLLPPLYFRVFEHFQRVIDPQHPCSNLSMHVNTHTHTSRYRN